MTPQEWTACAGVSVDPEVVHGAPVFAGTRLSVEDMIDNYYTSIERFGMSDREAVEEILESFPTMPGEDALRTILAFEAQHQPVFQP